MTGPHIAEPKLLVVEDDESLGIVLVDALASAGYRVERVADGEKGLERALAGRFDLLVLDLMLPRLDGYEICRRMRAAGKTTPVLMLTARGREEDRVKGFDLGADDYLVKPFSMKELLGRVKARIRGGAPRPVDRTTIGDCAVDFEAMTVRRGGKDEALTKTEAEILKFFVLHPGQVLSRTRFLDEVWGYDRYPTTRTVDMHLARVREKIGDAGDEPRFLRTVHGVGYRFDPDGTNVTSA